MTSANHFGGTLIILGNDSFQTKLYIIKVLDI